MYPDITINPLNFNSSTCRIFCNLGDFNNDGEGEILINNNENAFIGNSATMYGVPGGNNVVNYELEIISYELNNFPNPFNPTTTISFSILEESKVELSIYNIKGQKIKSLLSDQISAGEHSLVWDGTDIMVNQYPPEFISIK